MKTSRSSQDGLLIIRMRSQRNRQLKEVNATRNPFTLNHFPFLSALTAEGVFVNGKTEVFKGSSKKRTGEQSVGEVVTQPPLKKQKKDAKA